VEHKHYNRYEVRQTGRQKEGVGWTGEGTVEEKRWGGQEERWGGQEGAGRTREGQVGQTGGREVGQTGK